MCDRCCLFSLYLRVIIFTAHSQPKKLHYIYTILREVNFPTEMANPSTHLSAIRIDREEAFLQPSSSLIRALLLPQNSGDRLGKNCLAVIISIIFLSLTPGVVMGI